MSGAPPQNISPGLDTALGESYYEGSQALGPGMCAGFPAGSGNAHRFVNRTNKDAILLVVGDRTPFDEVTYPDIDNHAKAGADGKYVHTRKDGSPH